MCRSANHICTYISLPEVDDLQKTTIRKVTAISLITMAGMRRRGRGRADSRNLILCAFAQYQCWGSVPTSVSLHLAY
jgi:hypothetical protein